MKLFTPRNQDLPLKEKLYLLLNTLLFVVLICAIFVNQSLVNKGIGNQNNFNDYLILLNVYDIVSQERQSNLRGYLLNNCEDSLEDYHINLESKHIEETLEGLNNLGITETEQELVDDIRYIYKQLIEIEKQTIVETAQQRELDYQNILAGDDTLVYNNTTYSEQSKLYMLYTDDYMGLLQQHSSTLLELKNSVANRMTAEVTRGETMINRSFFIMTFFAGFVPLLLFINFYKTKKNNRIMENDKELQDVTLKNIADGIISVDLDGVINIYNPAAENITGFSVEEAKGKKICEVLKFKGSKEHFCDNLNDLANFCLTNTQADHIDIISKDGTEKTIAVICSKIKGSNHRLGVVFTLRDMTEKLASYKEKEKSQRLESLGRLAGGIAHDFNNSLTIISGNTSLSKLYAKSHKYAQLEPCLNVVEEEIKTAQRLTNKLLTFARGGMPIKNHYRISKIISESIDLTIKDSSFFKKISMTNSEALVDADYQQLVEVFSNILNNAKEAMTINNILSINLSEVEITEEGDLFPGRYVLIEIANNGEKIPESHMENLFEPYFSTKGGKGLGLAASYSIIRNHKGYITVKSNDYNTIFSVYLPIAQGEEKVEKEELFTEVKELSILVMDDENRIRNVIKSLLMEMGHSVDTASSGEEAIKLYKNNLNNKTPYDLVILDLMVVTGMGGKEALGEIMCIDPEVKAIVSSGYSNDAVMANYKYYGFIGVLPKPYTYEKLHKTLNSIYLK